MKLTSDIFSKLKLNIGEELGYGAHGQVFSLKDYPDRVIKFSKLYDLEDISLDDSFKKIKVIYDYLIHNEQSCFVKIYDCDFLKKGTRITFNGPQNYVIYYSIMEKLFPLENDEKKVFKNFCDNINLKFKKNIPVPKLLDELSAWFMFDKQKALNFWQSLIESPIDHNDIHRRNIMKDVNNNYKLVDFDKAKWR